MSHLVTSAEKSALGEVCGVCVRSIVIAESHVLTFDANLMRRVRLRRARREKNDERDRDRVKERRGRGEEGR